MRRPRYVISIGLAAAALIVSLSLSRAAPQSPVTLGGCSMFPADNIWNVPVDTLPVDARSTDYINAIGATDNVHADFGSGEWPPGSGSPIGIPFVVVPANQLLVPINWTAYGDESDPGPYPIPTTAPIEGGPNSDGDRHVLVVRQGECKLYELYRAFPNAGGSWDADSGAVYDLNVNGPLRPETWTSADAAGLPILPGLVRYDEVAAGEIDHAIRFTAPQTQRAYVWPARHFASFSNDPDLPPMGQRFRLKADYDISSLSHDAQVIARAMQTYGIILADNGSSWFISGAPDPNWDNDVLHELDVIVGSDFEAVDVSSLMVDPDSGQAVFGFALDVDPASRAIQPGGSAMYRLDFTARLGFGSAINLSANSPSPNVIAQLASTTAISTSQVTLVLTDTHSGTLMPGLWYNVPITATGGGFTRTATAGLLVGGARVYLPVILKND